MGKAVLSMIYLRTIGLVSIFICSCGQSHNNKSESETIQYAGLYDMGGDIEEGRVGSVIVFAETDNTILFYLDLNRGAPSYNMGQLYGRLTIDDDKGIFDEKLWYVDKRCKLLYEFTEDILTINYLTEEDDQCGFGHAVWANGDFSRQNRLQPEFFRDQNGDTIYFARTSPEKYNEGENE